MASIFIYNYNNYYNRKVKKEDALIGYGSPVYTESSTNLNFNPNDGVTTAFVAGRVSNSYNGRGDYLIYSEDNTSITSRWFVIEATRARKGQYNLVLKRDVIVDNYDAVLNADCFIKKATVASDSPFILNQESLAVNQIKTKEQPLYDESGCAWIVGYIDRKYAADVDQKQLTFTINADPRYDFVKTEWPFYKQYGTKVHGHYTSRELLTHALDTVELVVDTNLYEKLYWDWTEYSQAIIDEGLAQDGLVIKDGDKYYKVKASLRTDTKLVGISEDKHGIYLHTYYTQKFGQQTTFVLRYKIPQLVLELQEIPQTVNLEVYIAGKTETETVGIRSLRPGLTDAPYDMFCMPYMNGTLTFQDALELVTVNITKEMSIAIAQSIALEMGSANLYDLQLLPYCPLPGFTKTETGITVESFRHLHNLVATQTKPTSYYQCLFWCQQSHGTKNIVIDDMPSYTNRKIANQCDMYRLVAPNYQGQFEFNLAQNDTPTLPLFNVDYTYMPYNPYIHINPYFSGLFGDDYNDARGLICGGDYSIAYLSDAWKSYQLNNKNYQNIFDRQIQNMSTNYKINSSQKMIEGLVGAGNAGLQVGAMTGNALVGAGAAALSVVGGAADMQYDYDRYAEQKHYATDIHNYQLDNIKAMPYSLAKSTVINENNKEVPILETYTCTEDEKEAVANEIRFSGMTLGVIGKPSKYIKNNWSYGTLTDLGYMEANVIRIEGLNDDSHTLNAIADELNKGVYFK